MIDFLTKDNLTTVIPKPNNKRLGEWHEKDGPRKHANERNKGLEQTKQKLGWYEPVEQ